MTRLLVLLAILLLSFSCKKDGIIVQTPPENELDCALTNCTSSQEFYGNSLLNGECWISDYAVIAPSSNFALSVILGKAATNGISENLRFVINNKTDFSDTIWLGWVDFVNLTPGIGHSAYSYSEGDSSAGKFDFAPGLPVTKEDFLVIDFINEDTSIVEGRFQLRFSRRNVNSFVTHAPDSMQFQCGKFRAKEI